MRQEVKDRIANSTSIALTLGTSAMLGLGAGFGAATLANYAFGGTLTRGQMKMLGAIVTVGSIGIGWSTVKVLQPKFEGICKDIIDIFPTTGMKEVNNAE